MTDEVLRDAVKGVNIKELAADLGKVQGKETLSKSYVYQQLSARTANILQRCEVWLKHEKGDSILQWLCNENEGYFVKRIVRRGKTDHTIIAKLMVEFSEVMKAIAESLIDGKVEDKEYRNMRKEWQDVQALMESFFDDVESGKYN